MHKVKIAILLAVAACFAAPSALAADPVVTPNASQVCKSIRAQMGTSTFKATYGTNHNKSNALGKCVSAQAKVLAGQLKAAKSACKAEQAVDSAAFTAKYGTNKNKNNAYGKCVSAKASAASKAHVASLANAAKLCKAERKADPAAFKAKYGTNKNKKNAFGKCVSKTAKS
jgi:copper(I)-binding protein